MIVLCQAIRLMHPMAPFITEELFHIMKERFKGIEHLPESRSLYSGMRSGPSKLRMHCCPYPQALRETDLNPAAEAAFALMEQVVYTIRNIRGEMKLPPGAATDVYIIGQAEDPDWKVIQDNTQHDRRPGADA